MKKLFGWVPGVKVSPVCTNPNDARRYRMGAVIGTGTFGSVHKAKDRLTGATVAVKKTPDDANGRKELEFAESVSHRNVIRLLGHYRERSKASNAGATNLCLVMEYSNKTLKDHMDYYRRKRKPMPVEDTMLYTFQMFRALHYLHSLGIIHRDVKPSNFLLDKKTFILQICDLGSAEYYIAGKPRDTNVCSRPYRAPELELGNEDYDHKIDIWAAACIFWECCTGERLFREQWNAKHYESIWQVLGDPTQEDVEELLPLLKGQPLKLGRRPCALSERLSRVRPPPPHSAVSLIRRTLVYKPSQRPTAIELCADPFYDPLRRLTAFDGILYDFSGIEIASAGGDALERVVPTRRRSPAVQRKINEHHGADAGQVGPPAKTCRQAEGSLRSTSGEEFA